MVAPLPTEQARRWTELDGLRGLMLIAVLLATGDRLAGGNLGVDVFFVLSGFLITGLLLDEVQRDRAVRVGRFWIRRARRLFPALVFFLLGMAVYTVLVVRPVERIGVRNDGLSTLGYVYNWWSILTGQAYGDLSLARNPLQPMWSLAVEEQFYLFWPLVVILALQGAPSGRSVLRRLWGCASPPAWRRPR